MRARFKDRVKAFRAEFVDEHGRWVHKGANVAVMLDEDYRKTYHAAYRDERGYWKVFEKEDGGFRTFRTKDGVAGWLLKEVVEKAK